MLDRKGRCLGFRVSVSLGIERTPSKLPKTAATMQRGVQVEVVLAASIGHWCIIVKLCRFSPALQSRKKHFGLPFVRVTVTVCGAEAATGGAGVLDAEDGGISNPGADPEGAGGTGHQGGLSVLVSHSIVR